MCLFCSFPAYPSFSLVYLLVSQISLFKETEWDKQSRQCITCFPSYQKSLIITASRPSTCWKKQLGNSGRELPAKTTSSFRHWVEWWRWMRRRPPASSLPSITGHSVTGMAQIHPNQLEMAGIRHRRRRSTSPLQPE